MINVTKTHLPKWRDFEKYGKEIFESGWITNQGKYVIELQKMLENYLNVKHVLLVANGTLALQIAYKLLDLQGEIITTPFSFIATSSSLKWMGLQPVFSDIDPHTFNLDPTKIETVITDATSAIVPVHVFANCCDVKAIDAIAKKHNLKVIYDAAHAFGVEDENGSILNHGDVSILSFHATKTFHTIEGGALIINDDALFERAQKMINFGIEDAQSISQLGINAKMNEFEAAMGLAIFDTLDLRRDKRQALHERYDAAFKNILQLPKWYHSLKSNYSYYPVLFKDEATLLTVMQRLQEHNIAPRRYFYPSLDTLDFLQPRQSMPISRDIASRILCLPLYAQLESSIQSQIIKTVLKVINDT